MGDFTYAQLLIIREATKELYDDKVKLYKKNTDLPITPEEFEACKKKVDELNTIRDVMNMVQEKINVETLKPDYVVEEVGDED